MFKEISPGYYAYLATEKVSPEIERRVADAFERVRKSRTAAVPAKAPSDPAGKTVTPRSR